MPSAEPATRPADATDTAPKPRPRRRRLGLAVAIGTVVALTALAALLTLRRKAVAPPPLRVFRATSLPGTEGGPTAISPDGNVVVIAWTSPDMDLGDRWIKAVDNDAMRRLTETPDLNEVQPAWSPDGRQIAFVRYAGTENLGIYVISALGGAERKIADCGGFAERRVRRLRQLPFPVTGRGYTPPRVLIASPDGRCVIVSHIDQRERGVLVIDNFR
jgi:hypothetical protein